jgi:hypothetical protein
MAYNAEGAALLDLLPSAAPFIYCCRDRLRHLSNSIFNVHSMHLPKIREIKNPRPPPGFRGLKHRKSASLLSDKVNIVKPFRLPSQGATIFHGCAKRRDGLSKRQSIQAEGLRMKIAGRPHPHPDPPLEGEGSFM